MRSLGARPKVTEAEKLRPAIRPGVSAPLTEVVAANCSVAPAGRVGLGMVVAAPASERLCMLCESIRLVALSRILVPSKMLWLRTVQLM